MSDIQPKQLGLQVLLRWARKLGPCKLSRGLSNKAPSGARHASVLQTAQRFGFVDHDQARKSLFPILMGLAMKHS